MAWNKQMEAVLWYMTDHITGIWKRSVDTFEHGDYVHLVFSEVDERYSTVNYEWISIGKLGKVDFLGYASTDLDGRFPEPPKAPKPEKELVKERLKRLNAALKIGDGVLVSAMENLRSGTLLAPEEASAVLAVLKSRAGIH